MGTTAREAFDLAAQDRSVNLALLQGPGMAGSVQDLYLEVFLNSVHTRRVIHVAVTEDEHLFAWPDNLRDVGVELNDLPADRYLDLAELSGLDYRYDVPNQRLYLDAAGERLHLRMQTPGSRTTRVWPASVSPGALLNYDLYATTGEGPDSLAGATELRAFSRYGVLGNTGISRFTEGGDGRAYVRLDTAWTWSSQDQLLSLTAGDFISGSLPWSRPTRLGGLQLRRNFALQPQLITYPLPQFFGEAALPSSVELYVNGVRQYRGEVLPGPFQLTTVPTVSGVGQAQVVMTDALGRSRSIEFGFYNVNRLLQRGLSDYSLELGSVRRDYGLESFSYRDTLAASASLRHGLTDALTLEAHAEGDEGLAAGGLGAVLGLGIAGSLNGALAGSTGDGDGSQLSLGYAWIGGGFTANYQITRSFDEYRDIAAREGRAPPLRAERALIGYGMGPGGSLSLHYTRLDTLEEGRFRSVGANYSVGLFQQVSLYLGGARELDGDRGHSVFAGVAISLGHRLSAGASASRNRGRDLYDGYLIRPVPADGGTGWNLRSQLGDGLENYQAEVGYRGDHGQVGAGAWSLDGSRSVFATASGGVVMMERALFAARRVDDGFALVSTGGIAGVPVLLENRSIGRTDARGHYLLTGLGAYQPNQVSIEPLHLPAQIQFDSVRLTAVPADRSGVILDYGLREVHAALLILHDARGRPVPLGSRVELRGTPARTTGPAIVGYDGQVYLEDLQASNRIRVVRSDGDTCTLVFSYPGIAQGIPVIGPLICEEWQ